MDFLISYFKAIGGTGQTERQTDSVQRLMRPPGVDHIITQFRVWILTVYASELYRNINLFRCGCFDPEIRDDVKSRWWLHGICPCAWHNSQ